MRLRGFTDADWAGPHAEARLSTSGYVFKLAGAAISRQSRKQTAVALSSTESEYMAQAHALQESKWLLLLLQEFEAGLDKSTDKSTPSPSLPLPSLPSPSSCSLPLPALSLSLLSPSPFSPPPPSTLTIMACTCGRSFASEKALQQHISELFKCIFCGSVFIHPQKTITSPSDTIDTKRAHTPPADTKPMAIARYSVANPSPFGHASSSNAR
ncbi:Reverse transcriptase RNA-dependent DNA polymerase [Penicillium verhagenii]|nr:Reverse transcriptase RNA-dependent DNA polymerase [Penicillium verhagenii]